MEHVEEFLVEHGSTTVEYRSNEPKKTMIQSQQSQAESWKNHQRGQAGLGCIDSGPRAVPHASNTAIVHSEYSY
ncbi:hypothetical protein Nepgr_008782 [Nepenthes gracilis]|uniref:Uncharacterized protein n=1 Tax=Nepenthes gracilis TaxID=150966 RepID=A0AAD3XJJ9_NEPGR|nr:hypothetical protein Nepgr_008782 [Nepenthes gracilis]